MMTLRDDDDVPSPSRAALASLLSVALLLAVLADVVWGGLLAQAILDVDSWFVQLRADWPATRAIGTVLSALGEWDINTSVLILGVVACLLLGSPRRALLLVAAGAGGASLILALQDSLLRFNVAVVGETAQAMVRELPPGTMREAPNGLTHLLPSGHTFGATLDFGLVLFLVIESAIAGAAINPANADGWRRGAFWLWGLIALLCGVGRLMVGAHWYTDVLAGAMLACTILFATLAIERVWRPRA